MKNLINALSEAINNTTQNQKQKGSGKKW